MLVKFYPALIKVELFSNGQKIEYKQVGLTDEIIHAIIELKQVAHIRNLANWEIYVVRRCNGMMKHDLNKIQQLKWNEYEKRQGARRLAHNETNDNGTGNKKRIRSRWDPHVPLPK